MEYSVIVKGPNGPMKKAIQDRLTSISRIEEGSNNPLEIGIGVEARDLSILRNGQQQRTSSPCIFVRDVVTDIEDVFWSDGLFHSIIRDAISGKPIPVYPPEPRYWLPVQEVANAIRAMVVRNLFPCSDDPIQMAGRRPWENEHCILRHCTSGRGSEPLPWESIPQRPFPSLRFTSQLSQR